MGDKLIARAPGILGNRANDGNGCTAGHDRGRPPGRYLSEQIERKQEKREKSKLIDSDVERSMLGAIPEAKMSDNRYLGRYSKGR